MRVFRKRSRIFVFAALLFFLYPVAGNRGVSAAEQPSSEREYLPERAQTDSEQGSFRCTDENGIRHTQAAVHYFTYCNVDGNIFRGYYYHDESGVFLPGSGQLRHLKQVPVFASQGDETQIFDGFYMVNDLGRLSAAAQVHYVEQQTLDGVAFQGFYYFDESGKLDQEQGMHYIQKMRCHRGFFSGYYYFGGAQGALSQGGTTKAWLAVDENGKVSAMEEPGMNGLKKLLPTVVGNYQGKWSVYVKDLKTGETLTLNNRQIAAASLIKVFAMEETLQNLETVRKSQAEYAKVSEDSEAVMQKINTLLENMIIYSDNESFNELIRLQTESHDFVQGAEETSRYLREAGYKDTIVQHSLSPSSTQPVGVGAAQSNLTTVEDCGEILERIYDQKCVNAEISEKMIGLLLQQSNTTKIPARLSEKAKTANKTGENNTTQHDMAIVFGEKTDYILCVMSEENPSEGDGIERIRDISDIVYDFLNR